MSKFELIEDRAAEKSVVVVVGAGGSAAPALGDLLASLGCDAPASERKGTSKITDLNNAVLESSGSSTNDWAGFNARWLASPKAAEFLRRALELLQSEFGGSYLSVLPDPGTAMLLPFWNVVFGRAGLVPRYLLVTSDPAEVAVELSERFGIEQRAGHLVWLRAALDAEANSRGKLRAFADIAHFRRDPATTVKSVAKSLKLTFPRDVQKTFASKDSRLDRFREFVRLSKSAATQVSSVPTAADWVTATRQILRDWSSNGEAPEGRAVLDAIREAFDEAVPAFVGVGPNAALHSPNRAELEQGLEGRFASARMEIEELRKTNVERSEALEEAQEQLRARYSEIVTLTRMLATETAAARKFERDANRLGGIAQALERGAMGRRFGRWVGRALPWGWQMRRTKRAIERDGLFAGRAYLAANPDVESAGIDPLRHYLAHGASEGRPLGIE